MDVEVDDLSIARFVETTTSSADQARFFLEACGGNYNRALQMYQEQMVAVFPRRARPGGVPPRPRAPQAPFHNAGGPIPFPLQIANTIISIPFALLHASLRLTLRTLSFGAAIIGTVANRVLPPRITAPMRTAVRALTQGPVEESPASSAASFILSFSSRFGELTPQWQACGWQEATTRAQNEGKFLFVYLHSSRHQDADAFCTETLCNPEFIEYLSETFMAWGGDLRFSDAFRLSTSLRATAYPYCALLAFSGSRTRLITCVEGSIGPEALREVFQAALVEHGGLLWQDRAQREQRDMDRRIREEQDADYQRSLLEDQERERRAQEQRDAAQQAQIQKEQQERAAAEAAAAEERKKAEAAASLEKRRTEKRQSLPEEPPAGADGAALIRVRLPSGATHQRRFFASDALRCVTHWVDSLESHDHLAYSLAMTYPRRVFKEESELQQTLQELGLAPQAVLLVQPEDNE